MPQTPEYWIPVIILHTQNAASPSWTLLKQIKSASFYPVYITDNRNWLFIFNHILEFGLIWCQVSKCAIRATGVKWTVQRRGISSLSKNNHLIHMHEYSPLISCIAYGWCLYDTDHNLWNNLYNARCTNIFDSVWSHLMCCTTVYHNHAFFWIKGAIISNDSRKAER